MRSSTPSFHSLHNSKSRSRKFLLSRLWMSRMDSHITKTLGDFATRLAEIKQNLSTFSARLCKVETSAASASNISGSARSWPSLEQVDGSTATGSHSPGSSSDNRNARRRLDFPQTLMRSMREVPSCYGSHANNTTNEVDQGSVKNPTCRSSLYLKHDANVKTLLLDIKMVVFPLRLTVPYAVSKQLLLSANPDQSRTERLASNLHPCGGCWLTNSNFSSLIEMTKVLLSSQRSTLAHKSSALKIEETGLENLCSNVPPLEVDKHLPLLHLICVFLLFLLKCCNLFSLKRAQPMCDGRLFASSPFRRLAGRGAFFRGFPFRWVLHVVLSLTRSVIVYDAASCSREDSQNECGRPCDALSCLFFSALWLHQSQSLLVQEIRSAKDIDLTCFKTFPIKAATCLQVGPMSLEWPVDPFARFDQFQTFALS